MQRAQCADEAKNMHELNIVSLTYQPAQVRLLEFLQLMQLHILSNFMFILDHNRGWQELLSLPLVVIRVMVHCTSHAHSDHG